MQVSMFNEIYGTYFEIAAELLKRRRFTKADADRLISKRGFGDTGLLLPSKLFPQSDGSDWGLFTEVGDKEYLAVTEQPPKNIMTTLQKRWLKAKLCDPRMRLFISDDDIAELYRLLSDVTPLYTPDRIRYTDRFSDGDDYESKTYRKIFRTVLEGVRQKRLIRISFKSGRGRLIKGVFEPLRLEYSPKNDRFRLYCSNKAGHGSIINVGRILSAELLHEVGQPTDINSYFDERKCSEPLVVKVTTERRTVERFLMEFATFEKRTERFDESGECVVSLWYDKANETEILIQLLSFGPTIEILAPKRMRELAKERIDRQFGLTFGE